MHGDWWKRAHDAPSPWARAIATALTAAAVVAIALPLATSRLGLHVPSPPEKPAPRSPVTFVMPPPAPVPPPPRQPVARATQQSVAPAPPRPAGAPVSGAVQPGAAVPRRDSTRNGKAAPRAPGGAIPITVGPGYEPLMPTGTAHAGPLLAPPITGKQRPLTQIGADSARKALAEAIVREAPNHPMPQSEIDARLREQQREQKAQWDAHRPVALPVAGVSMPFPLFSPGPSKAQRKRDSIINAGNLKRLRHMLVFARERMDSLCHADSLAGKPEQCRKLRAAASLDLPPSTHPDSGGTRE